ncbi:phosphopantothenoylcysteine decarboxylase, partial [uncultured Marinobacter sp.]|uniref:phosphopantothenoylcysteine decarboxylase domain-containing protein n=1 Tax=uncultured Marinobacter sp. TaxID=187379 RepID=UPI0030DCF11E
LAAPPGVTLVQVTTAEQMLAASMAAVDDGADVFVATAAVADYRPEVCAGEKIKKVGERMSVTMIRNPDTLATVAARADAPFTVGFAAETTDLEHYATDKMARKQLSMIVANDVSAPGIGFNSDDNAVTVFWPGGRVSLGPSAKTVIARELVKLIAERKAAAGA